MNPSAPAETALIEALDHIVIAVRDLDKAADTYEKLLGRAVSWRGTHPEQGTANALFRLDNTYIELLAAVGPGDLAATVRARAKKREGLLALAFRSADIAALAERWRAAGVPVGEPRPGRGRDLASGVERAWRSLPLPLDLTRGVFLFAIEHDPSAETLPIAPVRVEGASALGAVDHVVVFSGDAEGSRRVYGDLLGLRLALDRSFVERGLRLLFFRVGGLTVEMSAKLEVSPSTAGDSLWGVAYRCADIEAARRRLHAAGFAVSDVRAGQKAGTRVCTVHKETHGVATLLIGVDGA